MRCDAFVGKHLMCFTVRKITEKLGKPQEVHDAVGKQGGKSLSKSIEPRKMTQVEMAKVYDVLNYLLRVFDRL